MNTPGEADILRFCVAMGKARDDEDEVKQVIEERLAGLHPTIQVAMLKVSLRVMVAQFYAPPCRRLEAELGYPITDLALEHERLIHDGLGDPCDDDTPDPPRLRLIGDS